VTRYVHAGIAASDAICAKALGEHAKGESHTAKGESHTDAVKLLRSVNADAAKHLNRLLGMKTRAGYGHDPVTKVQLDQAQRAVIALMAVAEG
jgi:hypothetical protein